ncbi:hypothetical protein N7I30_21115 [Aurantimonas litoralis]|nr:hypothetical protein [Aurantimonas litoralis]
MAKTQAEYQREYRERKKAERKTLPDETAGFIRGSFSDYFIRERSNHNAGWEYAEETCAYAGVELPSFETDEWPEFGTYGLASHDMENRGALSKAEMLVGALSDALSVLTAKLNHFKIEEVEARIAELETADLSDPLAKKQALREIVRLTKIRDRLGKEVRLAFPVTEVKG